MNFFGYEIKRKKSTPETVLQIPDAEKRSTQVIPYTDYKPSYAAIEAAGATVTHKTALTLPAAFAAISIKAENLASLPKQVFKRSNNARVEAKDHPVYRLIHFQPNKYMTDFTFWEKMEGDVAGWGNALAIIETNGSGYPVALWPVDPDNFTILKDKRDLFYKVGQGDFAGTYSAAEVLHFRFFTRDGINGIDPISYHAQAIGIGLSGQKFAGEFFEKKGVLRGTYEIASELGDTAYERLSYAV